jgi:hypothetical protein
MHIDSKSAGLHAHLEEAFGLPTPTDSQRIEVFGLYHTTYGNHEGPRFWCFDPLTRTWSVKAEETRDDWAPSLHGLKPDEQRDLSRSFRDLSLMERPPLPRDLTMRLNGEPFIFSGYIFAWYFVPELGRWELVPVGKR